MRKTIVIHGLRNDSIQTIQWLRYVLKREVHYTWRNRIWDLVEIKAKNEAERTEEPSIDFGFVTHFGGDEVPPIEMITTASVLIDLKEYVSPEAREEAIQGEKGIITFNQAMIRLYDGVLEYRKTSALAEDDQISFLFRFIKGFDGQKQEDFDLLTKYSEIAVSAVILPAQTTVRIIADVYGRNFWKLWWRIKNHIHKKTILMSLQDQQEKRCLQMSTKEFFGISDEERLYWWRKDGEVELHKFLPEDFAYGGRRDKIGHTGSASVVLIGFSCVR